MPSSTNDFFKKRSPPLELEARHPHLSKIKLRLWEAYITTCCYFLVGISFFLGIQEIDSNHTANKERWHTASSFVLHPSSFFLRPFVGTQHRPSSSVLLPPCLKLREKILSAYRVEFSTQKAPAFKKRRPRAHQKTTRPGTERSKISILCPRN